MSERDGGERAGPRIGIAAQNSGRAIRRGSAAAGRGRDGDGDRRARGGMDRRVRLRRVLVARVSCRLVGVAAARRRRAAYRADCRRRARARGRGARRAAQFDPRRRGGARSRRGRGRLDRRTAGGFVGGRRACSTPARLSPASGCSGRAQASAPPRSYGFLPSFGERTSRPISPDGLSGGRGFGQASRRAKPGPGRSPARSPARPSASCCRRGRTASRRCSGSGSRRRSSRNLATCSNPRSSGVSA